MKYIVSVSGGAGSTLAAHRAVEKHGAGNVVLLFADTNMEDKTLYDALEYMREKALPECDFVWLDNDGKNIWDVFEEQKGIRFEGGCKASIELKRKPQDRFVAEHWTPEEATRVSGLDYSEGDRIEKYDRWVAPYPTWHPMADRPILSACEQRAEMERLGYPSQHLYDKGYPHNNCGGACVLAGLSQWAGLLQDMPERYRYARDREAVYLETVGTDFTVLKDRRGGETKSMTLAEFEKRVLSGDTRGLRDWRSTCGCMTSDLIAPATSDEGADDV